MILRAIVGDIQDGLCILRQNVIVGPRKGFQGFLGKGSEQRIADMRVNHSTGDTQVLLGLAHNPVKDEMQRF